MIESEKKSIGRYVIEAKLGQGGMAEVYRAFDPTFKRRVAIKVLPAYLIQMDPSFAARFRREAETIASLEHPAIVPVHDFGEADGRPYLVMRLMTGGSLEDQLKKGPMSIQEAAEIFTLLAPAIDLAHSRGIIHRDLKPGNILFDSEGCPYLADFGIVRLQDSNSTLTQGGVIGTPAYMSPEQARGRKDLDGRSDIYSLGAILFQMLTGRLPYESDTPHGYMMAHLTDPLPEIREILPGAEGLDTIIKKAMAKGKEQRYASAREIAIVLEDLAEKQLNKDKSKPAVVTIVEPARPARQQPLPPLKVEQTDLELLLTENKLQRNTLIEIIHPSIPGSLPKDVSHTQNQSKNLLLFSVLGFLALFLLVGTVLYGVIGQTSADRTATAQVPADKIRLELSDTPNPLDSTSSFSSASQTSTTVPLIPEPTIGTLQNNFESIIILNVSSAGILDFEAISILNNGDEPISLLEWKLTSNQGDQFIFPHLTLFPDGQILIYSTSGMDTVTSLYWGSMKPIWLSGETASLINYYGDLISEFKIP